MASQVGQRSAVLFSLGAVVLGGLLAWVGVFGGLHLWGLVLGVACTLALIVVAARAASSRPPLSVMMAYGLAFVLLSWPILWLIVGLVRSWITGRALGD